MENTELSPAAALVLRTLEVALAQESPLFERLIEGDVTESGVMGALFAAARDAGLSVQAWDYIISTHPLPLVGVHPPGLCYGSSVVVAVDGTLVGISNGCLAHVYPTPAAVLAQRERTMGFTAHHTLAQELPNPPYADLAATQAMGRILRADLAESLSAWKRQALGALAHPPEDPVRLPGPRSKF